MNSLIVSTKQVKALRLFWWCKINAMFCDLNTQKVASCFTF